MLTEERKQELASQYGYYMERYLDKQWIDSQIIDDISENEEELEFLRNHTWYSVVVDYR